MTLPSSGWQHSCALVAIATGEVNVGCVLVVVATGEVNVGCVWSSWQLIYTHGCRIAAAINKLVACVSGARACGRRTH